MSPSDSRRPSWGTRWTAATSRPERPFVPRIVYVTSTFIGFLHLVWLGLVGLLVFSHRDKLAVLKTKIIERLARRPEATEPDPVVPVVSPANVTPAVAGDAALEAPPF